MNVRVCDICYLDGKLEDAVAEYVDAVGEKHDICQKHLELVKAGGFLIHEFPRLEIET